MGRLLIKLLLYTDRYRICIKRSFHILLGLWICYNIMFVVFINLSTLSSAKRKHDKELTFDRLLFLYNKKIKDIKDRSLWTSIPENDVCSKETRFGYPCKDANCKGNIPVGSEAKLRSVLSTMTQGYVSAAETIISIDQLQIPPTGKRVLFVTGASSNHYEESQALLFSLHNNVFPYLSNFSFFYFDLGLTPEQRHTMAKYCQCEIKDFPTHKLPLEIQSLTCYAWKAFIIQATISAADIIIWMDSCVSFDTDNRIKETIEDVTVQGFASYWKGLSVAQKVDARMMTSYNSTHCLFAEYEMLQASLLFFHNEEFIRDFVIKAWTACAVNPMCMCPKKNRKLCYSSRPRYGMCHRHDQASLSLIFILMFGRDVLSFNLGKLGAKFDRSQRMKYFEHLESANIQEQDIH